MAGVACCSRDLGDGAADAAESASEITECSCFVRLGSHNVSTEAPRRSRLNSWQMP